MNNPSWWDYRSLFERYRNGADIFVETGTHQGESVRDALELGYHKVISVEILPELQQRNQAHFDGDERVHLFTGDSNVLMPEMLELVAAPAVFWLDGHFEHGLPVWRELDYISEHVIRTHTIIIDDIGLLYPNDIERLKQRILEINPRYQFVIENQVRCNYLGQPGAWHRDEPWHLVAWCQGNTQVLVAE